MPLAAGRRAGGRLTKVVRAKHLAALDVPDRDRVVEGAAGQDVGVAGVEAHLCGRGSRQRRDRFSDLRNRLAG